MLGKHARTALAVIPLLALGLSACGTGIGPNASATSTAKAASDHDKMIKFAQCMRANGVDMPDPEPGGGIKMTQKGGPGHEGEQKKFQAAQEKCRSLMPNGGRPPKLSPADVAKMREFATCMRAHGVNMEDPGDDGLIRVKETAGPGKHVDAQVAQKACQKLMPEPKLGAKE